MECSRTEWLSDEEFLAQFNRKAQAHRIPLHGSFELTSRCNLKCLHCYTGSGSKAEEAQGQAELSTERVLAFIDDIVAAGCLFLLFTGGEPMMRRDFARIYAYARKKGLFITVFSNATLITQEILALFEEFPPRMVEISLYGATAAVYEHITGIPGSFEKCMNGIRLLKENGVRIGLKTILMRENSHEFPKIEKLAMDLCGRFRFDSAIFPALNGNKSPLAQRVVPDEAVALELANSDRRSEWEDFFNRNKHVRVADTLYPCGAGLTNFHIDSLGYLQPCLMTTNYRFDLEQGGFQRGWQSFVSTFRQKKPPQDSKCRDCEKVMLCDFCPAFFYLETGSETIPSDYLCELGNKRFTSLLTEPQ